MEEMWECLVLGFASSCACCYSGYLSILSLVSHVIIPALIFFSSRPPLSRLDTLLALVFLYRGLGWFYKKRGGSIKWVAEKSCLGHGMSLFHKVSLVAFSSSKLWLVDFESRAAGIFGSSIKCRMDWWMDGANKYCLPY